VQRCAARIVFQALAVFSLLVLIESSAAAMATGGKGEGGGGGMSGLVLVFAIFGIMYFLLIRPQQKRQKDAKQMQSNLKVGDRVTTSGGIHGTVAAVSENTASIKVAEKVKIEVDRSAIAGIMSTETGASK